jgi:hypothetical protein
MKRFIVFAVLLVLVAGSAYAFGVGDSVLLYCRDGAGNLMPYYTDNGAISSAKSSVGGNTFGSRYFSTYSSIVGAKWAEFNVDIPVAGIYEVAVTWGNGSNRKAGINHQVTYKDGATFSVAVDQAVTYNTWVSLGQFSFDAGTGMGKVRLDNSTTNFSGSAYADSVKLTMVQVVPEPSSMIALTSGLTGMAGFAIRRRKA